MNALQKSPCPRDCPRRAEGCHAICADYLAYELINIEIRREKTAAWQTAETSINGVRRRRNHRRKKGLF